MQDVTAGVPNGTSGQNLNVQRMDHIADFDFKLAYADFHANENNREINVESANSGSDAAVGSTASGMPPIEIDDHGMTNFQDHMREIALSLQAFNQTPEMSKKSGTRSSKAEQNKDQAQQELQ